MLIIPDAASVTISTGSFDYDTLITAGAALLGALLGAGVSVYFEGRRERHDRSNHRALFFDEIKGMREDAASNMHASATNMEIIRLDRAHKNEPHGRQQVVPQRIFSPYAFDMGVIIKARISLEQRRDVIRLEQNIKDLDEKIDRCLECFMMNRTYAIHTELVQECYQTSLAIYYLCSVILGETEKLSTREDTHEEIMAQLEEAKRYAEAMVGTSGVLDLGK